MKRLIYLIILVVLLLGLFPVHSSSNPVLAQSGRQYKYVDLLLQTHGAKEAVVNKIRKLGGEINYAYENAPVIAASVPPDQIAAVANLPNVLDLASDRLIYLDNNGLQNYRSLTFWPNMSGIAVTSLDPQAVNLENNPGGYASFLYSKANLIWDDTAYGAGSVVAVVDSGTVPNACLANAVIGIPEFPQGYNATGDGVPATDPDNYWHGTHVGGAIASACQLIFPTNTDDPLYQAISTYLPWGSSSVPILGQAPGAQIYPVKVFDTSGGGTPTSVILDGLDHLLTLKRQGKLDVDVVNLSLGGPTWYDGRDFLDVFLDQFKAENILVVTSGGNFGPIPNSIASPATSFNSIAVGALDYAQTSRTLYEYLGLTFGFGPGQGLVMRPDDQVRVANFSSRGPMSDGRTGPDISASGMWNFQAGPKNELLWASGTSFSAPLVAGSAALLNAYYENETGRDTPWEDWRNALLLGANPQVIGGSWQDSNASGYGALDASAALESLSNGDTHLKYPEKVGKLRANILGNPQRGVTEIYQSQQVSLAPGESLDLVLKISPATSKVSIDVFDIQTPDNSQYAFWPNALEIQVQSAKRTAFASPINQIWTPNTQGDRFSIEIEDGQWTLQGEATAVHTMEPGLMKVSLVGDFPNQSPVSFKVAVTRENNSAANRGKPIARSTFQMGDIFIVSVPIDPGIKFAAFELLWKRDWRKFPTSNLDMLVYDPSGNLASTDGATGSTPERAAIENPVPGIWTVQIEAIEAYKTDQFSLYLETD